MLDVICHRLPPRPNRGLPQCFRVRLPDTLPLGLPLKAIVARFLSAPSPSPPLQSLATACLHQPSCPAFFSVLGRAAPRRQHGVPFLDPECKFHSTFLFSESSPLLFYDVHSRFPATLFPYSLTTHTITRPPKADIECLYSIHECILLDTWRREPERFCGEHGCFERALCGFRVA